MQLNSFLFIFMFSKYFLKNLNFFFKINIFLLFLDYFDG
jgi:hypothetical protein